MDIYKSLDINIETLIKNPEMLKFVLDYLKTKKICKHEVTKLPYVLRYVSDWYKTQICEKAILQKLWNTKVCSWLLRKSRNV